MQDKNGVVLERFKQLIDNSGKARQEMAKDLKCDTSTITKHYNGDRGITADYLKKYALYFGVSADYLLGLSNAATTETSIQAISKYTGLNDTSINALHDDLFQEQTSSSWLSSATNFMLQEDSLCLLKKLRLRFLDYKYYWNEMNYSSEKMNDLQNEFQEENEEFHKRLSRMLIDFKECEDKRDLQKLRMQSLLYDLLNIFCADTKKCEEEIQKHSKKIFKLVEIDVLY